MILGMKIFQDLLDRLQTAPGEAPGGALVKRSDSPKPARATTSSAEKPARCGPGSKHAATTHPAIVYLLLDVSSSMDEGKLRQASDGGVEDAIQKGYRVGLIQFSSWSTLRVEPTTNLRAIKAGVSKVSLQITTNMASAIELATNLLGENKGERAMVLVTDGYPDSAEAALEAARVAKRHLNRVPTSSSARGSPLRGL